MSIPDIPIKRLEEYNDVLADIANVLLFCGEQRIREDDLENLASPASQFRKEDGQEENRTLHEMERDVTKLWRKGGLAIAVIGLENQSRPDHAMPLRMIAYDGASYKSELLRIG